MSASQGRGRIVAILERLDRLLSATGEPSWASTFRSLAAEVRQTADDTPDYQQRLRRIRSLYGGMGSFSDLVLQPRGEALRAENDELQRLRHQLFREVTIEP